MANINIHRGDDTDCFDGGFFQVDYTTNAYTIKKLEVVIGSVTKTFVSPTFPLKINLKSSETMINSVGKYDINLVVLDESYRRLNIATGSTVTFLDLSSPALIPYQTVSVFDLSEVLPSSNSSNNGGNDNSGDNTDNNGDDNSGDNTDNNGGNDNTNTDDTNTNTDDTQGGTQGTDNPDQTQTTDEPSNP